MQCTETTAVVVCNECECCLFYMHQRPEASLSGEWGVFLYSDGQVKLSSNVSV